MHLNSPSKFINFVPKSMTMLKVGVLGAGHLGRIHIKLLLELTDLYEFVGFFDPSKENSAKVAEEFGIKAFDSVEAILDEVDVIDIVTPTLSHYECAKMAMKRFKHTFIEKPITNTVEDAKHLIALSQEADVKVQVGHVERFNPAYVAAREEIQQPMFIEGHRLASFNPRGTDVSVVLDLMIHDLDIILNLVQSNVRKVSANGVSILSGTPDIANARIEFDNGCVANLTASRVSMKNMRKMRLFQKNAYIAVDFGNAEAEGYQLSEEASPIAIDTGNDEKKYIKIKNFEVKATNAIKEELRSFANAINNDTEPPVTIMDGYNALKVAHDILTQIEKMDLN